MKISLALFAILSALPVVVMGSPSSSAADLLEKRVICSPPSVPFTVMATPTASGEVLQKRVICELACA
ncbi:hypothetical protein CVT24_000652 [Panaeolus cyanescens]|uniref:Uncharacterized protein n=1 Tax=Panaeolus cyanescens TaxID=181874 RepID=A0A409YT58_9AGAR|nr:hypothetical protein CVT24_000652 [Panaeolus cyanescens]